MHMHVPLRCMCGVWGADADFWVAVVVRDFGMRPDGDRGRRKEREEKESKGWYAAEFCGSWKVSRHPCSMT